MKNFLFAIIFYCSHQVLAAPQKLPTWYTDDKGGFLAVMDIVTIVGETDFYKIKTFKLERSIPGDDPDFEHMRIYIQVDTPTCSGRQYYSDISTRTCDEESCGYFWTLTDCSDHLESGFRSNVLARF